MWGRRRWVMVVLGTVLSVESTPPPHVRATDEKLQIAVIFAICITTYQIKTVTSKSCIPLKSSPSDIFVSRNNADRIHNTAISNAHPLGFRFCCHGGVKYAKSYFSSHLIKIESAIGALTVIRAYHFRKPSTFCYVPTLTCFPLVKQASSAWVRQLYSSGSYLWDFSLADSTFTGLTGLLYCLCMVCKCRT